MRNRIIKVITVYGVLMLIVLFTTNCEKNNPPVIQIENLFQIGSNLAILEVEIPIDASSVYLEKGVCYGLSFNPTINSNIKRSTNDEDIFVLKISDLIPKTKYYVRAYAVTTDKTIYGNNISFETLDIVTDIDGNEYNTINIDGSIWMAENLKVTKYANGDPIPNLTDNSLWRTTNNGAYCAYENNDLHKNTYGCLYNAHAINDARSIAPEGWVIASSYQYTYFEYYFDMWEDFIETGNKHWVNTDTFSRNESGFTALPGGKRDEYGNFSGLGTSCYFWTSTESYILNKMNAFQFLDNKNYSEIGNYSNQQGLSVRCYKYY